ncbi:hypothetical protein AALC16_05340 [Lachnospiraceae bacterium 29-91]
MPKLFVVAGHGAGGPGTCGNGFSEAERVRVLARKIKELGGGNVILGDLSRDYYRDNGVSTLSRFTARIQNLFRAVDFVTNLSLTYLMFSNIFVKYNMVINVLKPQYLQWLAAKILY